MMKLLLADDHTLFRDALTQYIKRSYPEAEITVAQDFHQAFDEMEKSGDRDLVLLDLRMPGMDGLKGFEKMRSNFPDTPAALMSGVAEPHDVKTAIDLGAIGYFPKTLSGKALLKGIETVLSGEVFIPTDHKSARPMPAYYDDAPPPVPQKQEGKEDEFNLTPREKEVLGHLLTGAANKEIASSLGLQIVTVKLHVRGICRKLGAKNRTQAALIAREKGFG
jgi:DNA-binding NarL/FixJ family response regulator